MRFDVTLMNARGFEFSFDDDIGLGKTGFDVTLFKMQMGGNVGRLVALFAHRIGSQRLVKNGSLIFHRIADPVDRWQWFVLDFDEPDRLFGRVNIFGRNGRDRMPFVKHFSTSEQIVAEIGKRYGTFAQIGDLAFQIWPIGAGCHGINARQSLGS